MGWGRGGRALSRPQIECIVFFQRSGSIYACTRTYKIFNENLFAWKHFRLANFNVKISIRTLKFKRSNFEQRYKLNDVY